MSSNIRVNSITPSVGNSVAIGTAGGTVVFQCDTINFSETSGVTNFTEDISVDGHTELDNVNISGIVTTFDLNVDGQTNLDNVSVVGITTLNGDLVLDGHLDMRDSDRLRFGAGDDLQIFHNGTNSYIDNVTGSLYIRGAGGNHVRIQSPSGEESIVAAANGSVDLYYDNSKKFETTNTGAKVTGNLEVTGVLTYEDVTNVDSIGIVTARNGIDVSGGTVSIPTVSGTNNNANQAVLFQTAAGVIDGGSGLLYNPAEDALKVNGNVITSAGVNASGVGPLKLSAANYSSTQYIKVSNKIEMKGNVGINEANPAVSLDLSSNTDAVALPQGTTAQRPTGSAPYIRKNTTNNALEYYDGTSWVEIITDYFPTGSVILG